MKKILIIIGIFVALMAVTIILNKIYDWELNITPVIIILYCVAIVRVLKKKTPSDQ